MHRKIFGLCLVLFAVWGCDGEKTNVGLENKQLDTKFVTIATGGSSGPYNIIGSTLAEVYSQSLHTNSKTQTTGGSIENLNLLAQDKVEMAFVMSDALNDATMGTGNFKNKIENVAQIATLYPNFVQIITSKNSGIKTIEDLKGKRVAVGDQNSGVEKNAKDLLYAFGITYDDIKVDYLSYAAAADALQNGRIDAAFLTSGLPNASVLQLSKTFDLALVEIPAQKAEEISKNKSYFIASRIPIGTYGNTEEVPTMAIKNALVVSKKMSDSDVYELTKTFLENLDKLQISHQAAKGIDIETVAEDMVAPIHPGAKRYYDEIK